MVEGRNPVQAAEQDAQNTPQVGGENDENQNLNQNVIISALETIIPVIPPANEANIKSKFKHQKLTKILGHRPIWQS